MTPINERTPDLNLCDTPAGQHDVMAFDQEAYERDYQTFVESMVPHCHCDRDRPCDGVLAGGLCDGIRDDPMDELFRDEEDP